MNTTSMSIDEDEIDLGEVFSTMGTYKYMIFFFVLLFGLASAAYVYFTPSVYKAYATVEVGTEQSTLGDEDIFAMAMDSGASNTDTEIDIMQSRFVAQKALEKVNVSHHYYTTVAFKKIELYKDSPFQVGMLKGYDVSFELYPIDDKTYRLVVDEAKEENATILSYDAVWSYDAILPYGEEIVEEHFHLNIVKTKTSKESKYSFVVMAPEKVGSFVQEHLSASPKTKRSNILELSYEDNVALRAQEFTNALAKAYIEQSVEKKTEESGLKLTFIDKQLKLITDNLKSSAIKIEEFKKSSNTTSLNAKAENIIMRMSDYESKLAEISMQEEMLDTLYVQVKSGKNLENITIVGLNMEDAGFSLMIKELQDAIMNKKILREDYTEMYPEVSKLRRKIVQLKKIIVATIKNLRKNTKEKKILLQKSISKEQKLLNRLPADERMYGQLERKFSVNENIYSYLLEKQSETAIIKASTISKNRVIDMALYPEEPIKPKRTLVVLVGLILGLIFGILLAFLRAFLDNRIKNEEDVTWVTDVPLLAIIPTIGKNSDKIKVFSSPKSSMAEAFRNLRTNLQFMAKNKRAHVIVMTSTVGGEGKTTMCINLAGIMSMANKKTIVLNLDMRKPTLHEKFGLNNAKGMSNLLSGHAKLSGVIQSTSHSNLDIIASGPVPPNPSELIQNGLMEKVLVELREMYDVIILDTPPVGLVTDAKTLMHLADTSIYVLRANYSKKEFFQNINKLYSEKISGFGILLNDVAINRANYGYGYYEDEK